MATKKGKQDAAPMELAEKLVEALESQRQLGAKPYPLPLEALVRKVDPQASPSLILAAVRKRMFADRAIFAKSPSTAFGTGVLKSPVSLREDLEQLARSPLTLELALRVKRTKTIHAHSIAQLAEKLTEKIRAPFKRVWNEQRERGELPPTVAFIQDRVPKLFLIEDLQPAALRARLMGAVPAAEVEQAAEATQAGKAEEKEQAGEAAAPWLEGPPAWREEELPPEPPPFAARFDEAFARLDRQKGGHNFVSLVDLRRALADVPREQFDAGLRALRIAGRYSLSAGESLYGLSPEERQAGIEEAGSLLLYVSRKQP